MIVYWEKELSFVWMEDDNRWKKCSREKKGFIRERMEEIDEVEEER